VLLSADMPISIPRKGIRISCSGGPYCDGIRAPSLAVHIVLADGEVAFDALHYYFSSPDRSVAIG
jgi:hypothetical protein